MNSDLTDMVNSSFSLNPLGIGEDFEQLEALCEVAPYSLNNLGIGEDFELQNYPEGLDVEEVLIP